MGVYVVCAGMEGVGGGVDGAQITPPDSYVINMKRKALVTVAQPEDTGPVPVHAQGCRSLCRTQHRGGTTGTTSSVLPTGRTCSSDQGLNQISELDTPKEL